MSTISNRFIVSAIEDGTTLHGNLRATGSLVQAYNNGSCIPDWSGDNNTNQPIIYLSLMNGSQYVLPDAGGTWYYNGTAIVWADSSATAVSSDGLFQKVSYTPSGYSAAVPAIKIINNLASSTNVNIDIIKYSGTKTISTAPISFASEIEIRISEYVTGGYIGILDFLNGKAEIASPTDTVTVNASLWNESGQVTNGVTFSWYLNNTAVTTKDTTATAYLNTAGDALIVTEPAVLDYATVKCEFYKDNKKEYTAYVGIDDTQDPEYMYVQQSTGSGSAASLRSGESVTFQVWVGTMDDPTVDTSWNTFKVLLLNAAGEPITGDLSSYGIAAADANNYRAMTVSSHVGSITIPYGLVTAYGKAITGIIMASTT